VRRKVWKASFIVRRGRRWERDNIAVFYAVTQVKDIRGKLIDWRCTMPACLFLKQKNQKNKTRKSASILRLVILLYLPFQYPTSQPQ
jgi:hypothetical protein